MPGQWKPPTQPVDSGWKPPTASIDVENKPAPKKGGLISTLSNAWDSLNTPAVRLMSPETRSMSDDYGNPTKDDSVWKARAKGFLSGAMGGIDDLVSSQSAPMNIGLEAIGLGGTAASARAAKLAKGAKDLNKVKQFEQIANTANKIKQGAGAGMAAHGIYKGAEGENIGERMGGVLEALGGAGLMFSGKPLKVNKPTNNGPKLLKAGQYEAGPSELGTVPGLLKKGEQPEVVINNKGQREVRNRFDGSYAPQPEPIGRVPEENPNLQGQFSRIPEDHPDYVNPELQGQTSRIPEDRPGYVAPEFQPIEEPVTQPVQEPPRTAGPNNGMPSIDDLPESWKPFAGEDSRVTSLEPEPVPDHVKGPGFAAEEQAISNLDQDAPDYPQQLANLLKSMGRPLPRWLRKLEPTRPVELDEFIRNYGSNDPNIAAQDLVSEYETYVKEPPIAYTNDADTAAYKEYMAKEIGEDIADEKAAPVPNLGEIRQLQSEAKDIQSEQIPNKVGLNSFSYIDDNAYVPPPNSTGARPFEVTEPERLGPIPEHPDTIAERNRRNFQVMDGGLDEGLPIEQEMSQIDDIEARRQQMKDALKGKTRATARMGSLSFDRPGTFSSDNLSSSEPQALGAVSDPTGNSIPQAEPEVMGMPKNMGEIGTPEGAMPSVGEVEGSPAAGSNSEVVPPLRAKDAEARYQLKVAQDEVDQLNGRMSNNKLTMTDRQKKLLQNKIDKAQSKLAKLLSDESGSAPPLESYQAQEAQKLRTFGQKFKEQLRLDNNNPLTTIGNLSRSLMSSLDLSPLRQAAPLMGKAEYWKNIGPMIRMFGDEDFYNKTMNDIKSGPNYKYKVQNGLQLTDINGMREEQFLSNLAEEVPFLGRLVKSSNRAFTGYLDLLRDKVSDDLLAQATQQGRMKPQGTMDLFGNVNETFGNDKLAKEIMNFVNTATGRGSLGRFEQSAKVLNATLFSPRLMVSRINMLRPDKYITADPLVRKEMLKSMGTFFGAAVGMNLLASMVPGVSTSFDPTSSDFMKIKTGNTRIDIGGGFQQYLVLMARTVPEMAQTLGIGSGGKTTSSSTGKVTNLGQGYGSPDGSDILYNFMESKEAPMISFAMGLLKGKDFEGKPFNAPRELVDRFMPMIIGDMRDILNDDPKALPFLIPAVFGAGVQTYPPKKRGMSMGGLSMGNMKLQ